MNEVRKMNHGAHGTFQTGDSMCKGPEAHSYLACSVIDEEAHMAGAVSEGTRSERQSERQHSAHLCKPWRGQWI